MERKSLLETEAYLEGLSSVSNKPLQPIRLCGFNAKISRFQVYVIFTFMQLYETILWVLAVWTLLEGLLVSALPAVSIRITRVLFPKWGDFLADTDPAYLRKLGLIEFTFGLLLAGYLLWGS